MCRVLRNFDARGTIESPQRSGRPPKLTERDKRSVGRLLLANRRAPLAEITNQLPTTVSPRTLRKAAHEIGFHARVAARKPFLMARHIAARLEFAKQHKNWTVADWKKVIWTDESTFEIGKNVRRIQVWRRTDERFNPDCLAPTFKSGRSSVMVWGAFVDSTTLPLVVMPPSRRTAADFVDIVYQPALGPFLEAHDDASSLTLMEDGAPVHRSNAPRIWREEHHLKKLAWPAQSPDLNPIENLWKTLKDEVQTKSRPKNVDEMQTALHAAWQAVPPSALESLVASMPDRIKAVLAAKGGSTRW